MTYLELLHTLHDNGATTTASLLAALNDNALLAALGVADSALVDVLKHDITASNVRMALLVGDSQYRTEHFATEQACRAHCEAENALIVERDYQGNKEKWLNDGHALEWLPVTVADWLDYMPFNNHPLHGYICQQCGKPSPVGVGFVTGGAPAFRASHGLASCDCGFSVLVRHSSGIPQTRGGLEGELLKHDATTPSGTIAVNLTNLNALLVNTLGACELLKTIYPAIRTVNHPLVAEIYSRTEELHLCAQVIKQELNKGAAQ